VHVFSLRTQFIPCGVNEFMRYVNKKITTWGKKMNCQKEHMLTFDALKCELMHCNLRKVARETDLHYNTVYRFMNTEKDPKYSTMKALSDYVQSTI
jgi:DNA-binding phage protein